jgi:positive regulator of sigma E activity
MSATCLPSTSGNRVIEVADGLGVSVGQRVEIELESTTLLLASFLAYLVPVLLLLAGALIGFYGAGGASTELWSGIGALCGFITGLLTSRALGKALEKRGKLTPVIVATVENEGKEE